MTTSAAGRVNRRFLFLALILAVISAILVYVALSNTGEGSSGSGGGDVSVVVAKSAIPAGTTITGDMLEVRNVPEAAVGEGAFRTIDATVGQVARYPMAVNQQVLLSTVVGGTADATASNEVLSHIIEAGKRGMGVKVDAVVNGGGLVLPGDHVDVYWVPDVAIDEDLVGAGIVAENVEVLAVSQTTVDIPATAPGLSEEETDPAQPATTDDRVRASEAEPNPEAVTIVLLLTPEQASRVFCADADGVEGTIRLAVRAFGDESPSTGVPLLDCIVPAPVDQPA
jgi:pilus assembly protein CpaB